MSAILEKRLESWTEFDQLVRKRRLREWIYRGQTDASFKLKSSLFHSFQDVTSLTKASRGKPKLLRRRSHEQIALQKFMSTARQYDVTLPLDDDPLEWLAVMQHYGAPTRLLDVTFSPYVAAYFALESGVNDSAIYCFRQKVFKEYDESFLEDINTVYRQILDTRSDDVIYVYEPKYTTPRLLAQQGLFLVAGSLYVSHEEIVEEYHLDENDAIKIIIPRKLREEGVHYLRRVNITSTMLFPGIEGFCKFFRHQPFFIVQSEGRIGELEKEDRKDELKRAKRVSTRD